MGLGKYAGKLRVLTDACEGGRGGVEEEGVGWQIRKHGAQPR